MPISVIESPTHRFDPRRGLRLQRRARRHRHLRPLPAPVRRRPRSQDVDVHRGGVVPQVKKAGTRDGKIDGLKKIQFGEFPSQVSFHAWVCRNENEEFNISSLQNEE